MNKKNELICEADDCNNIVKRKANAIYCSEECRFYSNYRYVEEKRFEFQKRRGCKCSDLPEAVACTFHNPECKYFKSLENIINRQKNRVQ